MPAKSKKQRKFMGSFVLWNSALPVMSATMPSICASTTDTGLVC